MNGVWLQDAAVGLVVLAAVGFLVWKRLRARKRPTPYCGDCPGCAPGPAAPRGEPLVGIGESGEHGR